MLLLTADHPACCLKHGKHMEAMKRLSPCPRGPSPGGIPHLSPKSFKAQKAFQSCQFPAR